MILVAALSPSLDLTYSVEALSPGTITRTPALVAVAGGKALNLARAAATVGAQCRVVALLGGAAGRHVEELLRGEHFPAEVVDAGVETRTCVAIGDETSGRLTEVYQDAPPVAGTAIAAFLTAVQAAAQQRDDQHGSDWLAISGRAPAEAAGVYGDLIDLGRAAGLRVAVDTHSAALTEAVDRRPELVKVNRAEAAALLGVSGDTDPAALAVRVHRRTGHLAIITDGTAGSVAHDGQQTLRVTGPSEVGRFAVGSGDSFFAGLLAVLDAGGALAAALRQAAACGAANAMVPGQGVFAAAAATRLLADVEVSAVSSPG